MAKKPSILIIPDAHAHPDHDNDRFTWIGERIAELKPTIVISVGDFADMPSLSLYDKGKLSAEGRRYSRDVAATQEALEALHTAAGRKPAFFITHGNHEDRIDRAASSNPELYGKISKRDLGFADHGWTEIPFKEVLEYQGWYFSHHFPSGMKGEPPGGPGAARKLLTMRATSIVYGHSHLEAHVTFVRGDGKRVHALEVGCMSHKEHLEGWNRNTAREWSRKVVFLEGVEDGDYERKTDIYYREK